jgi:hypothetical protein
MLRRVIASLVFAFQVIGAAARAQAATGTSIPFQYLHNGIFVSVEIDGTGPYTFLIDTDTTPSVIDLGVAKAVNASNAGPAGSGTGIGNGSLTVYPMTIRRLTVGDISVPSLYTLAADLSGVSKLVGAHIDGVLGTSFLNGRIFEINYACRTVSFPSVGPAMSPTAHFRWGSSGGNIIDDVWVGDMRVPGTFDSGNGTAAVVTGKGIRDLHLEAVAANGKGAVANGYLGQAKASLGQIDDVRLGSVPLGALETKFVASMNDQFEVNIGNPALERFIVTMDYKHGLLTLSKPGTCPSAARR